MVKQNKQVKRHINTLLLMSGLLFAMAVLTPVAVHADYRSENGLDGANATYTCSNDYLREFDVNGTASTTSAQDCEGEVSIEIGSVFELVVNPEELDLAINNGFAEGSLTAQVKSSRNYTIGISPAETGDANMYREGDGGTVDTAHYLAANVDVRRNTTNAWRVRNLTVVDPNTANNGAWTAITATSTPHIIYNSAIINANTNGTVPGFNAASYIDTVIPVQLSTRSDLPSGTYKAQITVTAAQTD